MAKKTSRSKCTKLAVVALCFICLLSGSHFSYAQEDLQVLNKNWLHFSDAPTSIYRHFSTLAFEQLEQRREKVASLESVQDWQKRQEEIKEKFAKVLGSFPDKTPLRPQVTKKIEKPNFTVEHIIYESQPGFYVSSSLYLPKEKKGKVPAIIYCSGHAPEGYRSDTYQHVIQNLVNKGFAVFAFDPVGQGERLDYPAEEAGRSLLGGPTKEHSYPGAQAFIAGRSQAWFMIWDGIRAVDYLLTRKEIDSERIGITGRSGGGTQSSYIAAMDERIYAAAPENYITSFQRLIETNGPQDAEQNFLHGIAEGLDHADLLAVRAPKPALMITTTRDIFNIQGARETFKEVAGIYEAYDRADNFTMVEDDAAHASTLKNREAMYDFFQIHLGLPGSPKDEETVPLTPAELQVTSTGQVATSYQGETVFSLNQKMTTSSQVNSGSLEILDKAKALSGYRSPSEEAAPVMTGRIQREGYVVEKYFIKGEGDYIIPYLLTVPDRPNDQAVIYLHSDGKATEAEAGGEIEALVKQGFTVLAADLLGIGEVGSDRVVGDSNFEGSSYNVWFGFLLTGRSIVGVHAADIVRLGGLLKSQGLKEVHGWANGKLSPALLHAAAFEPLFSKVVLKEPLSSYASLVTTRFYKPEYVMGTVPAALKAYDLPQLASTIQNTSLLLLHPVDGEGAAIENPVYPAIPGLKEIVGKSQDNAPDTDLKWLFGSH
jgi:cephalosporin-C deacetylase-like acetyl esterase